MEELREPTPLQVLRGHRGEVTCADAAGALLASGGGDRSLRLWRWEAARGWQEAARVAVAHRYGVTAARFGGGGALLASAGVDGCVRVWAARDLAPRRALAAPGAAAVRALCWAGRRLLAGHDDGALCVWHVARGALLARLRAHEGALHAVAAPARAALLLTACTDGVLKVFDLAEVCRGGADDGAAPAPLTWLDGAHDLGALCADAATDGTAVATGGHDALVRLWRASPRGLAPAGALAGHGAAVTALRWAGGLLLSASLDRTARLWAAGAAPACLHVLHGHARYLTCVALAPDLSYAVTGSNDRTVRIWSLGSLKLEDELEAPCAALDHFALGDLEGIGPVDEPPDELPDESPEEPPGECASGSARREWHAAPGGGPINSVATHGDLVATASSDGAVRLYLWRGGALEAAAVLRAHQYPALAVDFGAAGALLLSAGLDGRAVLWDAQVLASTGVTAKSGLELRVLSAWGEAAGGGGVRGARVSPRRPTRLLLATDDGTAPVWALDSADPGPERVYECGAEALLCCAWSGDARALALGAAGGELRVLAPPSAAPAVEPDAHDGGVQSCDFAPSAAGSGLSAREHLLATAGSDSYIKLWIVEILEEGGAALRLTRQVAAHGGGAACVRWAGARLASAGADGWARVWRAGPRGAALRAAGAACAAGAGGVLAAALLAPALLLTGTLAGELALWRLPVADRPEGGEEGAGGVEGDGGEEDDDGAPPALWGPAGVARWLRESVTRAPGARVTPEEEAELIRKSCEADVTGSQLVNAPVDELLEKLGYGINTSPEGADAALESADAALESADAALESADASLESADALLEGSNASPRSADVSPEGADASPEGADRARREETRARLRDELAWLRRAPPPAALERAAPHALLCPLSHRLLQEPASAADGYTYERANILDWFIAAGGAVSPVSARRLRNTRLVPNYALRARLRQLARDHERAGCCEREPL